jgi:site-specific DNA-methyltransferase (adenine-specific)
MAVAIEDAGFEIRDCIEWVYASGYPKGKNIGNGWNTALKPAHEPICMARKPIAEKTIAKNVETWGTGGLNIDGCRIGISGGTAKGKNVGIKGSALYGNGLASGPCDIVDLNKGRFPANLIHDGSEEVMEQFPYTSDAGSAARYFASFVYETKARRKERGEGNNHPTVKPIKLIQYLCRMVTPVGGIVLDPFGGSGTTALAAIREGFDYVLIELNPEYVEIAKTRVEVVQTDGIPYTNNYKY